MALKKPITFSVITVGITAIVAQIVLLREFITIFYGNEISVGIILASWLLLGALGSYGLGRFADNIKNSLTVFCACQLFLSVILPFSVIFMRSIKGAFGLLPGEIMPLGVLVITSPVILAPLCVTLGFLFALSCNLFPGENGASKIGRVYMLESAGAVIGGLTASFFLIKYFGSMHILIGLSVINLAAGIILINAAGPSKSRAVTKGLSYTWGFIFIALVSSGSLDNLDRITGNAQWKPLEVIESKNSIYGNVTVAKSGTQISFFTNGLHNFTVPDQLTQEEEIHFSLAAHANPKRVLLVGGGSGGLLWEILKHPVARIDYVEIDPLIINFAHRYLSRLNYYALDDPRVSIINADGRFFIKNTTNRYDVILLSVPDPYTAQLNRFYTKEFFEEAKDAMKDGGILSFGVTSSENYISPDLGRFLGSINNTLRRVFSDVSCIPGDTLYFLASDTSRSRQLISDYKKITNTLLERRVETGFVKESYLVSKLSGERTAYLKNILEKNRSARVNLDFRPISYYYNMILWSTYFGFESRLRNILLAADAKKIWSFFMLLCGIIIAAGAFLRKGRGFRSNSTILAIWATGFSEIAFEIVVILAFQIIYGYLYYKIGLMLTSFMLGLLMGSVLITKNLDKIKDAFGFFTKIQICVILYPLILPVLFSFVARQKSPQITWFSANLIFPLLPIVAGFIGGLQFPLGNKIYLSFNKGAGRAGGITYGADLLGASLGAVIVSTFMVPVMGIYQTCMAVALLNLCVLSFLLFSFYGEARH